MYNVEGFTESDAVIKWVVNILLPDHVGLPHVLDLAVHLVTLQTWVGRGSGRAIIRADAA